MYEQMAESCPETAESKVGPLEPEGLFHVALDNPGHGLSEGNGGGLKRNCDPALRDENALVR